MAFHRILFGGGSGAESHRNNGEFTHPASCLDRFDGSRILSYYSLEERICHRSESYKGVSKESLRWMAFHSLFSSLRHGKLAQFQMVRFFACRNINHVWNTVFEHRKQAEKGRLSNCAKPAVSRSCAANRKPPSGAACLLLRHPSGVLSTSAKARAAPHRQLALRHITPEWMLHSNLRLLCGNHFIIKHLKGKLSKNRVFKGYRARTIRKQATKDKSHRSGVGLCKHRGLPA